jgi:lipid-A-disaccharide synthase-like uncharacterized protein
MMISSWHFWLLIGLLGQACFFARFLFQWIASERRGESVVPESFWWFSLVGCGLLLSYAIYRGDVVFILGQSFGSFVYLRNLHLIRRKNRKLNS